MISLTCVSPTYARTRKVAALSCGECGHVWTEEEKAQYPSFIHQHMVQLHGYKQVGAQVFRSVPCVACPKPGLYKVGSIAYCREHRNLGDSRRRWSIQMYQQRQDEHDRVEAGILDGKRHKGSPKHP